jgi:hypothetical protein
MFQELWPVRHLMADGAEASESSRQARSREGSYIEEGTVSLPPMDNSLASRHVIEGRKIVTRQRDIVQPT